MQTSLEQARDYLEQLDLSYIANKMCDASYPLPRWRPELIKVCEKLYKRFLWLNVKYPGHGLVPTLEIDEFWHNHILYTKDYTNDCQQLFGHYLHHQPSDGNDEEQLLSGFEITKQLYTKEFNEPLVVLNASA